MILGDKSLLICSGVDVYITEDATLHDDEAVGFSHLQQLHRVVPELGGQDSIAGDGGAAALGVAEDDIAGFDLGAFFDFGGEPFGDAAEADWIRGFFDDAIDDLLAAFGLGAFGDSDDGEAFATLRTPEAVLGNLFDVELDLRDQNHIGPTRKPGVEGNPPGVATHELNDHHAVMGRCGGMHTVECFGRDMDSRLETEGDVGAIQIVVDCFGYADAVEAFIGDRLGDRHGAVAADDDECFDFSDFEMGDTDIGEVFIDDVAVFVLAHRVSLGVGSVVGPEDGAAHGEDVGDIIDREQPDSIFDQPKEPVLDAVDLDAAVDRVFDDRTDDGIKPWAVTPAGEDCDFFDIGERDAIVDCGHGETIVSCCPDVCRSMVCGIIMKRIYREGNMTMFKFAIAIACFVSPCLSGEPVELVYKFDTEKPMSFEMVQEIDQNQVIQGMSIASNTITTTLVTTELVERNKDGSVLIQNTTESVVFAMSAPGIETTYDSTNPADAGKLSDPSIASIAGLVGLRVQLLIASDGTVLDVPNIDDIHAQVRAMEDPAIRAGAEAIMGEDSIIAMNEMNYRLLPTEKVEIGDQWSQSFDLPLGVGNMTMSFDLTLAAVNDGIASISIAGLMTMDPMNEQGVTITMSDSQLIGSMEFNIEAGLPDLFEMTTTTMMVGTMAGMPDPILNLSMTQQTTSTRIND